MGFTADSPKRSKSAVMARPEDWLVGGGEMGKLIRSKDWSATPLGPIESWPQSLRTTVSLCLASNFPISLVWGAQHTQIYNDGYWPICGAKHPHSMGQDFTECWAAPWAVIGESFDHAIAGQTSFLEDQRMFLDRNGYLEETCFTFSFSPIRDETGGVGGLFHPVTETTSRMLSERRTRGLRDLAGRAGKAHTIQEACSLAAETLADYELDVPFTLFYLFDATGKEAHLTACSGLPSGSAICPEVVRKTEKKVGGFSATEYPSWPLFEVAQSSEIRHCNNLTQWFEPFAVGPYPEPVKEALALPILVPGCERAVGVLVAGVSSRLPLNETYRAFYDLLAAGVTTIVSNARSYEEERKRAEALAEIDRAKTEFFSNVSHEFRTPLTLMLGPLSDELGEQATPLPPARRERLDTAYRNSLRLLKLVNTLLDFSRLEAGRVQASYEPTDLATLTAELASVFRSAIEKAGLTLTIDCPPAPEPIFVDREMWEKIVLNLLSNALKHTFEGGIIVKLSRVGEQVELSVADSGVGIPAAALPRLFERFHRVKGAKSRTHEGTGIGLALVKELALLHGGEVRVNSEENKGTIFTVALKTGSAHLPADRISARRELSSNATRPDSYVEEAMHWLPNAAASVPAPPPSADAAAAANVSAPATSSSVRRARILWADDNADMRDYVRRLLAERYEVIAVPDGLTALAKALEESVDLVLSDVMMPGLDGFGLLRELRNDLRTSKVPVILLSARAGEESSVEGLDAGADDYLAKPFSTRELLARVRTHLELSRTRIAWSKELEQANQELEAFSYSVSHDLRAPLRAIDGFSKLLIESYGERLDAEGRRYLGRVRAGTHKMSVLIEDLLDLSRIGRAPLRKESIDLTQLAKNVIADLREKDPSRQVSIDIAPDLITRGDARLLNVVLVNLLDNAWKFTAKTAEAQIIVGQKNNETETVFFIQDNGAGFDMAYADKLFAPFRRLHLESEFEGTGIGLATVLRIVARHGGRIWADSALDKGSIFFFTLEGIQ
jgi:signal transduction histidine kinase